MLSDLNNSPIIQRDSLGGGCIGEATKITTQSGETYFLKSYQQEDMAQAEAKGLELLTGKSSLTIPKVITVTDTELVLSFISQGIPPVTSQELLGRGIAELHRHSAPQYGLEYDNFIGATPQKNKQYTSWSAFYLEQRLGYQLQLTHTNGHLTPELQLLYEKALPNIIEHLMESEERPALLHGDLWRGNVLFDEVGAPVLIDPAAYYGHREAELAMTKLFGDFDASFYGAYQESYPLLPGWQEREDLYKLYHILNHLNLFGQSYYRQVVALLRSYE